MSVGHVARMLEEAGIATAIIAVKAFRSHMKMMTLPRVLLTPYPMGRVLGPPGDHERQRKTILAALDLLKSAEKVGTIIEMNGDE